MNLPTGLWGWFLVGLVIAMGAMLGLAIWNFLGTLVG